MKSKSPSNRSVSSYGFSIVGRPRLVALIVTTVALAAIAFATISLAQTGKPIERSESPAQPATKASLREKATGSGVTSKRLTRRSSRNGFQEQDRDLRTSLRAPRKGTPPEGKLREWKLKRGRPFAGDLRGLPQTKPIKVERPEREEPELNPQIFAPPGGRSEESRKELSAPSAPNIGVNAPAPPPTANFEGLDFQNWGAGHPADTNGDVGPNYYIQTINTSIGIFDKTNGNLVAAFTFNTFMSQGQFGNLCDTNNLGDPVVLYDTFEDRWVITDFAFQLSGGGAVVNPPGAYQCFAVSKSGDPVSGGWNFYSLHLTDFINDYPKFGIWPDGIYMSANMFGFPAGGAYQNPRVWALNKAQMYAGAMTVQSISFDAPATDFTILPSNARLQTGTPPPGRPNLLLSTAQFVNAVTVYKFHVDWDHVSLSTFTGPDIPLASNSWPNSLPPAAPSLGGNNLDVVAIRGMMQNQYTNLGGVESLWATHTVRRADVNGFAAPRFYQVPVTGGIVGANMTQAATFDPDGSNVIHRFIPSLAVDRAGNMALAYSTSSSTSKPAIKYAGRLSTDPINTFSQTEQVLIQGAGTQTGNCGGALCTRWGDYSAMTLDPDGCTFWYTNMYYQVDGLNHQTRIGSFTFPQCTTVGAGTIQGTVTSSSGGVPIGGATVSLGSRTTITDGSGFYSFANLSAGTYPSVTAMFPGYTSSTFNSIVVNDGGITSQNFVLSPGAENGCLTDTSQLDFQRGVQNSVEPNSSGDVVLASTASIDQQNLSVGGTGFAFNANLWIGQTFQPAVTGQLTRADLFLFCSGCTGTTPNLNVSIRATSADLPTGPDLAITTMPGFSNGAGAFFAANFVSPPTLTAGTRYALIVRPVANPSAGTYAYVVSPPNIYANGRWVASTNGGSTWLVPTTGSPLTPRDLGFKTFMKTGFTAAGNFISGAMDANPHTGGTVTWTTLSWSASVPAGTSLRFQVAASNSPTGPFNFVGPDGTAATFFTTSGASLAQFDGLRYLKYQGFLSTTISTSSPTVNDVTVCFSNTVPTTLVVNPATGTYGGTADLSATLTDGVSPLSGKTVNFTLNGNSGGSAITDGSGLATLPSTSLAGINANTYPSGVGATFAGDPPYLNSSGTSSLTVGQADATINVTLYNVPFDGNSHTATGSATGVKGESLAGLNLNGTTHTSAGNYAGDPWTFTDVNGNYHDASGTVDDFIIKATSVTTVTVANATYDGGPHGGTASVSGAGGLDQTLPVTYAGRNSTVYGPSATPPTDAGDYTASAGYAGDPNHSASSDAKDFTIFKASSVTTVNCPASVISTGLPLTPCNAAAAGVGSLNTSLNVSYANNVLPGTATASAVYGGDNNHSGSSGSATFIITAPPSGPTGNFVIGDLDAVPGNKVTFWGAQWAKLNSLSGGPAPAGFKGFANSASANPPDCGGAWASDPGNSSGPPSSVPQFITVIVSSSITRSGSMITGNNYKMVIVKTDPGYTSDPGHAGTGTVVSVVCP